MIITDRTIPELMRQAGKISRLDMINFCFLLHNAGVDRLELTREAAEKMVRLPKGLTFLFRVKGWADLCYARDNRIKHILIDMALLENQTLMAEAARLKMTVTAEVLQKERSLKELLSENMPKMVGSDAAVLRIVGLEKMITGHWVRLLRELHEKYQVQFELCPTNDCFGAVGTILDAAMSGIHAGVASFTGIGEMSGGYAPIEEVLVALAVVLNRKPAEGASRMPEMKRQFERFVRRKLSESKPVLGECLFKMESGIHVDGIGKNPETYEPYPPVWVGQERQLIIGKHSGRKAIVEKLEELHLSSHAPIEDLLVRCRTRSIELGHSLSNVEFQRLVKNMPHGAGVLNESGHLLESNMDKMGQLLEVGNG